MHEASAMRLLVLLGFWQQHGHWDSKRNRYVYHESCTMDMHFWHFSWLSKGQLLTPEVMTVSAGSAAGAITCNLSMQTAQASKQGQTPMHGSNCSSSGEDRGSCGS